MKTDEQFFELNGVRLPNDPNIITPKVAASLQRGNYERPEVQATPKFLAPDDRVIELGAGIGYISTYIAKHLNVRQITCVEANPKLITYIHEVHELHGLKNAEVRHCVAMPDTARFQSGDTTDFYIREPFWSSSLDAGRDAIATQKVPLVHLSDLIKECEATALIVDIEGGERDLFRNTDLGSVTKVYVELHTRYIRPKGIKECFDALSEQGYYYDQRVSHGGVVLFRRL